MTTEPRVLAMTSSPWIHSIVEYSGTVEEACLQRQLLDSQI